MASPLEQLPAEVFARIVIKVQATGSSLASFAAASQQCQTHVEAHSFLDVHITRRSLSEFERIVTHNRFLAIRNLSYDFIPVDQGQTAPGDDISHRINPDELDSLSDTFTAEVSDLLSTLKRKSEAGPARHPGLELILDGSIFPASRKFIGQPDGQEPIQFDKAWVKLLRERIPDDVNLTVVTSFWSVAKHVGLNFEGLFHNVSPPSWITLLGRFPRTTKMTLESFDDLPKGLKSRRKAREEFGLSLQKLPDELKELHLIYKGFMPDNHTYGPPKLAHPDLGRDIFSRELGSLSSRLVKLELESATLDLVEFLQTCAQTDDCFLEQFFLKEQQMTSAAGTWYFVLDPRVKMEDVEFDDQAPTLDEMREYMTEDELPTAMDHPRKIFRSATDPILFKKVYLTAAKAVQRMPRLQIFEINFAHLFSPDFGTGYHHFHYSRGSSERPYSNWTTADIKVC